MDELEKIRRRAFRRALAMLSRRSRSREEIVRDLSGKGYEDCVVESVVSGLETRNLLDDVSLSRDIVRECQRNGKSRSRIYAELRRRGIGREQSEESMKSYFDPSLEEKAALRLMRGMIGGHACALDDKELRKAARRLCARGFSISAVSNALDLVRNGAYRNGKEPFLDTYCQDS